MTSVTLFGEFSYGDQVGLSSFLFNHMQAHFQINQALAQAKGVTLDQPFLQYEPDADWFAQHWLLHRAISSALGDVTSLPGLGSGWSDESSFNDWMRINNLDHEQYNQLLGLS